MCAPTLLAYSTSECVKLWDCQVIDVFFFMACERYEDCVSVDVFGIDPLSFDDCSIWLSGDSCEPHSFCLIALDW